MSTSPKPERAKFPSARRFTRLRFGLVLGLVIQFLVSGTIHCLGQTLNSDAIEKPPLQVQLENRNDELRFQNLLQVSTVDAELFRRSLLQDSKRLATTIAVASLRFRDSRELKELSAENSYDLSRFRLSHLQIVEAIEGTREISDPADFYGAFRGKWYGLWEKNEVDHHWGDYVPLSNPTTFQIEGDDPVQLIGYQYAWVGDGYGINHLAQSTDTKQKYLLGYVVHVRDQDPEKEFARRPHVGILDGPGRLIWITAGEVFFEELIVGKSPAEDRYFITGFRYSIKDKVLHASQAFQAIYSRDDENREPWHGFEIELSVNPPKT